MRALVLAVLAVVSCTSPPPAIATPSPSPEPGVLAITALLDLSGPRAAIGTQQRNALRLWLDQAGSRAGPAVKVRMVDVAGSDAKLLIELRRAAVEDLADAVIVGSAVTLDGTLGRAIDLAALPVILAQPQPADPVGLPGGSWAFALSPSLPQIATREIDDSVRRGVLVPSFVLTDGSERIDPMAAALAAEVERRRLDALTRIAMPADGSVVPVVRSSLSVLRSVHCTSLPASCAPLAQMASATGARTFFYLSFLTTPADLGDHRDLAARAVFPATRTILPAQDQPKTPTDQMRDRFLRAFGERHGAVGPHAATAYDAIALLAIAADRAGAEDRAALRDSLEKITMPLIASTYTFGARRHAGSDPDDIAYVRWVGSAIAPALAPSLGTGLGAP